MDRIFAVIRRQDLSTELRKLAGPNVHIIAGDLDQPETLHVRSRTRLSNEMHTKPSSKSAAAQVAEATGGSLDVFINNAALIPAERKEYTLTT